MPAFFPILLMMVHLVTGVTPTTGYDWPLAQPHKVVRGFVAPPQPWAAGHRGVDLLGEPGQPVLAAGPGVVAFSGVIAGRGVLSIQHPEGRRTTYEPLDSRLPAGTSVATGQVIGRLSATGSHCAPATCLHWGLLVAADEYRDPLTLLRRPEIVLLPLAAAA